MVCKQHFPQLPRNTPDLETITVLEWVALRFISFQSQGKVMSAKFVGAFQGKTAKEVWEWYGRLADSTETESKQAGVADPLSPAFLRHYLNGKGKDLEVDPPSHLKKSSYVESALIFHRKVYLSQEPLNGKTGGIQPRLKKSPLSPAAGSPPWTRPPT